MSNQSSWYLDDANISNLINAIEDQGFRSMVIVAAHSGCRYWELVRLRFADIDISRRAIFVQPRNLREHHPSVVGPAWWALVDDAQPQQTSLRVVRPLGDKAAAVLDFLAPTCPMVQESTSPCKHYCCQACSSLVFPPNSGMYPPDQRLREACEVADIYPAIRFDDLKRIYCRNFVNGGGDAAGLIMTGVAAMQEYESEAEEWADWEEETRLADGRFRVN